MFDPRINKLLVISFCFLFLLNALFLSAYGLGDNKSEERLTNLDPLPMQLSSKIDLGMIIAALAFIGGFWYNANQIKHTKNQSEAQFWLSLREFLLNFDDIHFKLRGNDGADWYPPTKEEWAHVEGYMGTFEHCYHLLEKKMINKDIFSNIYGYRINNIVNNAAILNEKLASEEEQGKWQGFIELFDKYVKKPEEKSLKDRISIACSNRNTSDNETIPIRKDLLEVAPSYEKVIKQDEIQILSICVTDDQTKEKIVGAMVDGHIKRKDGPFKMDLKKGFTNKNGKVIYEWRIDPDLYQHGDYIIHLDVFKDHMIDNADNLCFKVLENS